MNIKKFLPYTKAIVAGIAGFLSVLAVFISVASDGSMSGSDWFAVISAASIALGGTGTVYQLPNAKLGK